MKAPLAAEAVWFDLDGTLIDSSPDLVGAAEVLCAELGEPVPDAAAVARSISAGGRAILRRALPQADAARIDALLPRYLDLYAGRLTVGTRLYDGIAAVLDALDARGIRWGVVTNKAGWLAEPLLEQLGLAPRCAAVVCGDTLPLKKPDPAPVLHACRVAGVAPGRCVFVGDDLRDVQAGGAAGARTIAAAWGYLDGGDPFAWGADAVVASPFALPVALGLS